MKIGVRLPTNGPNATGENVAKVARWAQQLGFHSVWANDHVVLPPRQQVQSRYPYSADGRWQSEADTNWLDPLTALAWAAVVAPDVMLGTSVLVLPLRDPTLLAKQAATVDHLSGGRLVLGIGVGWMREEFVLLGAQFEGRGRHSADMAELMRKLWSGQPTGVRGRSGTMQPRPANGSVPILWGGHSEAALARVARLGDGWLPLGLNLDELEAGLQRLGQLCQQHARDFDSPRVVVNPGRGFELTAEALERLANLGIDHVLSFVPVERPDLSDCHECMRHIAEIARLQPRG